jgi:hypothetical protein
LTPRRKGIFVLVVEVAEGAAVVDVEVGVGLELVVGATLAVGMMVEEVVDGILEVVRVRMELEGIEIEINELDVETTGEVMLVGSAKEAVVSIVKKGIECEVIFATVPLASPVEFPGEVRFPVPLP